MYVDMLTEEGEILHVTWRRMTVEEHTNEENGVRGMSQ